MFPAFAAEEGAAHAEAFYVSPEFWVAIAFVILVSFSARPLWRLAAKALDEKITEIRERLDEAAALRDEANELLASYKRKLAEAEREADDIVAEARDEAQTLRERMRDSLEVSLKRRETLAIERIAQAEAEAEAEIRAVTADVALAAARELLIDAAKGEKADELIDDAIRQVREKMH